MLSMTELISSINSVIDNNYVSLYIRRTEEGYKSYASTKIISDIKSVIGKLTTLSIDVCSELDTIKIADSNKLTIAICPIDSDYQYLRMMPWTAVYIIKHREIVIRVIYDPFRGKYAYVHSGDPKVLYSNGKILKYSKSPISNVYSTLGETINHRDCEITYLDSFGYNTISTLIGLSNKLIIVNQQDPIVNHVCRRILRTLPDYEEYYVNGIMHILLNSGGTIDV